MALNREIFDKIDAELDGGEFLTFEMVGDLFGQDFWIMLTGALMDAQSAARAISGAINKLRQEAQGGPTTPTEH